VTAVLVTGLAGCVAAAALTFGVPLVHFVTVWFRLTTIATTLGAYDSSHQAESASHPRTGIRPRPPERGHVRPALGGWANGLPRCWVIYGKTVPPSDKFDRFEREAQHYTDLAWTLTRRRRGRSLLLAQAPALPEIPTQPEPAFLAPWVLPVGDTALGPAVWDVTRAYHRLVVGRTGSQKTSHAAWLAGYAARMRHWTVIRIDPEVDDPPGWLDKLRTLDAALERQPADVTPLHRYLVLVDEFDDVMDDAKTDDHPAERAQCRRLVRKLLRHGGKRGIHVDAYAQDPRAKVLGSGIRSKFGARAALALDHAEIPLVLNQTVSYAPDQPGRGWFLVPGAKPADTRFHTVPIQQPQPYFHPADQGAPTTRVTRIYGAIGAKKWR
jgi:hypothetical protein